MTKIWLDFNTVSRSDFSGSLASAIALGSLKLTDLVDRELLKTLALNITLSLNAEPSEVDILVRQQGVLYQNQLHLEPASSSCCDYTMLENGKCWICFNLNANVLTFLTQLDESNLVQHTNALFGPAIPQTVSFLWVSIQKSQLTLQERRLFFFLTSC